MKRKKRKKLVSLLIWGKIHCTYIGISFPEELLGPTSFRVNWRVPEDARLLGPFMSFPLPAESSRPSFSKFKQNSNKTNYICICKHLYMCHPFVPLFLISNHHHLLFLYLLLSPYESASQSANKTYGGGGGGHVVLSPAQVIPPLPLPPPPLIHTAESLYNSIAILVTRHDRKHVLYYYMYLPRKEFHQHLITVWY